MYEIEAGGAETRDAGIQGRPGSLACVTVCWSWILRHSNSREGYDCVVRYRP